MVRVDEELRDWNLYQRAAIFLLAACVVLLAVYTAMAWFYLSGMSRDLAFVSGIQGSGALTH